jgi:hypothetical protein
MNAASTVRLAYITRNGSAIANFTNTTIYDGKWHAIAFIRRSDTQFIARFDADTVSPIIVGAPTTIMPPGELTLGCARFDVNDGSSGKFSGCIGDVKLNDVALDTFRKEGEVGDSCSDQPLPVTSYKFDGNGCATLNVVNDSYYITISFEMKSSVKDQDAVLLALGDPGPASGRCQGTISSPCNTIFYVYTSADRNDYVFFVYASPFGGISGLDDNAIVRGVNIYDGKKHVISMTRTGAQTFALKVDDTVSNATSRFTPDSFQNVPVKLMLGCSTWWPNDKYVGCIGNVTINGKTLGNFEKQGSVVNYCD